MVSGTLVASRDKRNTYMERKGWLTKDVRKRNGKVWSYHFYRTRDSDGARVENTVVLGPVEFVREKTAGKPILL